MLTQHRDDHPIQHIGNTILLVMMDVEEGHEAEFAAGTMKSI